MEVECDCAVLLCPLFDGIDRATLRLKTSFGCVKSSQNVKDGSCAKSTSIEMKQFPGLVRTDPGLAAFLKVSSRPDRPFDVLLIDDTSRLSRNLSDSVRIVETLRFQGFRVVSVSQGIDSQNEQSDVLMTVHGLVDSLYIKELAKKTHRGLEGRALQGFHTGGRCFGYDNIRDGESVRLQINDSEAAIVQRIFQMAADGGSLKVITKSLNRENIPPPRKRAGKQRRHMVSECNPGNASPGLVHRADHLESLEVREATGNQQAAST